MLEMSRPVSNFAPQNNKTGRHGEKTRRPKDKMTRKEYVKANHLWLAAKIKEEGVTRLEKGLMYKVLESGDDDAPRPDDDSIVSVHYTGWTIDGKRFDTSRDEDVPCALRLRDLIEGWIIALKHMRVGDRWELYIPAELGYGDMTQPDIPGGSTLIFDIELTGVA